MNQKIKEENAKCDKNYIVLKWVVVHDVAKK